MPGLPGCAAGLAAGALGPDAREAVDCDVCGAGAGPTLGIAAALPEANDTCTSRDPLPGVVAARAAGAAGAAAAAAATRGATGTYEALPSAHGSDCVRVCRNSAR